MRSSWVIAVLAIAGHAHADRLGPPQLIARGDYLAPQLGPDGTSVLVTGPQLRGLQLLAGGTARTLTDEPEAGVHARWLADGSIAYRARRAGTRHDLVITGGATRVAAPAPPPIAFAKLDRMYVQRGTGVVEVGTGDRFFGPVIAPGADRIAFSGLATGLHIYTRSTGALVRVGPGTAPAWSPDGSRLVFEVTEDDGHRIVASELYLYDVARDRVSPLTATDRVRERRPAFSPDGSRVVFDDDTGGIFVARLVP